MLGHARLSSTDIYTHVAIRKLIEIHARTHPAALLKRRVKPVAPDPKEDGEAVLAVLAEENDEPS